MTEAPHAPTTERAFPFLFSCLQKLFSFLKVQCTVRFDYTLILPLFKHPHISINTLGMWTGKPKAPARCFPYPGEERPLLNHSMSAAA